MKIGSRMSGQTPRLAERQVVWLLCGVAALRVFVFSAAFPFFNNVDEEAHYDMVVKYARGEIPRGVTGYSAESARNIALFGSPEFLWPPQTFTGGKYPPPLWTQPSARIERTLPSQVAYWRSLSNQEFSGPPLYYAVAGGWLRLGELAGLGGGFLLYWIRFLNVPLAAALVWMGYVTARPIFAEGHWIRVGVPMLLAFFPQDIFYSIQSDVFSPLCFGAVFLGLACLLKNDELPLRPAAITGLSLAATWLAKTSNAPLVAAGFAVVFFMALRLAKAGKLRKAAPGLALLLACAILPMLGWMIWSRFAYGSLTGSTGKIELLGWTRKPFAEWWRHPIFSPSGLAVFWRELLASFWRGEFVWHGRRLAWPAMDTFYWISSAAAGVAAAVGLIRKKSSAESSQRGALRLALASFAAAVVFLAWLSIIFDFHNCFYPSRAHPYFTSGRLMSGALIPFTLVFAFGLEQLLSFSGNRALRLIVAGGIVLAITVSEIFINLPAFSSAYNWFHFWIGP